MADFNFQSLMNDPQFQLGLAMMAGGAKGGGGLAGALGYYQNMQQAQQQAMMNALKMKQFQREEDKQKKYDSLSDALGALAKKHVIPGSPEQTTFENPPILDSTGQFSSTGGDAMTTPAKPSSFDFNGYMAEAMPLMLQVDPKTGIQHGFDMQERQYAAQARMDELKARIADRQASAKEKAEAAKELAQMRIDAAKELAQMRIDAATQMKTISGGGNPYFMPIQTPEGIMSFNTRGGTMAPVTVGGKPVMGAQYSAPLQEDISKAKERGQVTGKMQGEIPIREAALDAVKDAQEILDKGIYTGGYAAVKKGAAKYNPLADKVKVQNTEDFVSAIGNTVVPRLKEFGGNDSNEEMNYLKSIQGGDISYEETSLRNILKRTEAYIQRGIYRVKNGGTPDTPVKGEPAIPPRANSSGKKTKRVFNPRTGRIEDATSD